MKLATRYARPPGLLQIEQAVKDLRQPVVIVKESPSRATETKHLARIAELEAEASAAQQRLNAYASQAWLEAELRIRQENSRIESLTAEVQALKAAAVARAQREERMKSYKGAVTDGRSAWEAKMGYRQQPVQVAMTSTSIITADVWQHPPPDE
jgi:hypothetical protein